MIGRAEMEESTANGRWWRVVVGVHLVKVVVLLR